MARLYQVCVCIVLMAVVAHVAGVADVGALVSGQLPSWAAALGGGSEAEFEALLEERRDSDVQLWVGEEECHLEGEGFTAFALNVDYQGAWTTVEVLGADEDPRRVLIGLLDSGQVSTVGFPVDQLSGALVGRCWMTSGGDVSLLGSKATSEEGEQLDNIEQSLRVPWLTVWMEDHAAGASRFVEGELALGFGSDLLNFGKEQLRSTVLELQHVRASGSSDWARVSFSGNTRLHIEDVGWFEVSFQGTEERRSSGSPRVRVQTRYQGRCAVTESTGAPARLTGSLSRKLVDRGAVRVASQAPALEGTWERTGDEFEGMQVAFRRVGDDWYGFVEHAPAAVRRWGWRAGQVKMLGPRPGPGDRFELMSLRRQEDGTNPVFDQGIAYFREDGMLVWIADDVTGGIGGRQYWRRVP